MANNLPIAGRTYDLLAFQGQRTDTSGRQTLSLLFGSTASSVTGILKLVQRALMEFFTVTGSMPFLPLRGCDFMTAVTQGRLKTDIDVYQEFAFAANQVLRNLAADVVATDPLDERLAVFELQSFALGAGQITLNVTIQSAAGTGITVPLPITTSP